MHKNDLVHQNATTLKRPLEQSGDNKEKPQPKAPILRFNKTSEVEKRRVEKRKCDQITLGLEESTKVTRVKLDGEICPKLALKFPHLCGVRLNRSGT